MAWRIAKSVVKGEIDNRARGTVTGKIWLLGREDPLTFSLSGNCWRDLAGFQFVFTNPDPQPGTLDASYTFPDARTPFPSCDGVGVTGTINGTGVAGNTLDWHLYGVGNPVSVDLQAGTATGRFSSSKPNLQNIPVRSAYGQLVRRAFCARSG